MNEARIDKWMWAVRIYLSILASFISCYIDTW